MSFRKNVIFNYIGTGGVILAPILALPWYLAALGPQQFGLIGFVTTLQALLNLLDAGMSQALVRELSISHNTKETNSIQTATLLLHFERIYWLLAATVGGAILLCSGPITTQWLQLGEAVRPLGLIAIYGAAALFMAQFPGSLYRSVLVSVDRQVTLNQIMLAAAIARHVGGVLAVLQWPTLTAYLAWHVTIALAETGLRAYCAWGATGMRRKDIHWRSGHTKQVWPGIAKLATASGLGALTMQLDKLLLSHMASMEDFGYYAIAASLAGGMLQLVYPLMQASLPRAIQLKDSLPALRRLYRQIFCAIGLASSVGGIVYMTLGQSLLALWLRSPQATPKVYPLLGLLLAGAILNAFYNIGYMHWLANGKFRQILQVNLLACVLCLLLIPVMVGQFGVIGATAAWIAINVISLAASLPDLLKISHEKQVT